MKKITWPNTKICKLLQIKLPLIQAPMAKAATPKLIAAVCNAGGLGSFAAGYLEPNEIRETINQIRNLTKKPFAVNLFVPSPHKATHAQIERAQKLIIDTVPELNIPETKITPPYSPNFDEQIAVILEEKIPIFSFTFGIPSQSYLLKLKENGTILIGTATTVPEAILLEEHGIDVIVAQGYEAGGHRGGFLGTSTNHGEGLMGLLSQMTKQVNTPILAAGGIMDAKGIVAALVLGASGVQLGTAFLASPESGIATVNKKQLLNMKNDNTILTRAFSGRYARGIKNQFVERMEGQDKNILDYPMQLAITRELRKIAESNNSTDFMQVWAGQAASLSTGLAAGDLVEKLNHDVKAVLKSFCD